MIISFEQQATDILSQALEFNWEFQKLVDEGKIIVKYVDILEDENLFDDIREMVKKNQVKRLVIDSLTAMQNYPAMLRHAEKLQVVITRNDKVRWTIHEQSLRRMIVHYFVEALKELEGTTTILISDTKDENPALSSDGISEFLCDAVIVLYYTGISGDDARNLQIRKIRWTKQKKGFFQYEFGPNGIEISNEGSGVMMK
ncbi:hypothetical protein AUJ14_03900 [Candidatus Micrarchaeota archaeon CG1_02_55_22]|nr:MAG: hypothetical protein AUJ14_03900 [Candidatus Micrarchaeota archaeon CG1_02_55_22]